VAGSKTTKTKAKTKSRPSARGARRVKAAAKKKVKKVAGKRVKKATAKKTVKRVKTKTASAKTKPLKKTKTRVKSAKKRAKKSEQKRTPRARAGQAKAKTPAAPAPPPPKPIPKTRLSDKHLREFQEMLLMKRAELAGDVVNLTEQALQGNETGDGKTSSMPIHMADLGSDNWEKEFTLGLIDNEKALVKEIDEALQRINNRTYGVCLATRKPITLARLRAKPWAKYCIEYARKREEGRLP
jgi:DnaK suppressor protein